MLKYRYFIVYLLALLIAVLTLIAFFQYVTWVPKGYGGQVFLLILYVFSLAINTITYVLIIRRAVDENPATVK